MDKGGDGPSKLPPESKGKGKGKNVNDDGGQASLIENIMQSARSSVTPANLSSLMTSNGKSVGLSSNSRIPEQSFNDSQQYISAQSPSELRQFLGNGFHQAADTHSREHDDAYQQFAEMGSSRMDLGIHETPRSSSPVFVGPYSSAQSLDAALHDQVRASSSQWNGIEEAWHTHSSIETDDRMAGLQNAGYDEAWARSIPMMPAGRLNDMQRGANIDELLQTVSLSDQPSSFQPPDQPIGSSMKFMDFLEKEERQEEDLFNHAGMSEEQAELHRSLNGLQNSEDRADELIRPPDDDASARTGVFAATPEEALQAIWNGTTEGERASALVRDSQQPGERASRRIRELLKRGSYVDDVYGIPPQLQKTIIIAEEPETEENRDRRAKAISRLDALYRHLGASSSPEASIDEFVRNW